MASRRCVESVRIRSCSGPYSVQMQENTDQKNSEYGHFSCSEIETDIPKFKVPQLLKYRALFIRKLFRIALYGFRVVTLNLEAFKITLNNEERSNKNHVCKICRSLHI